MNAFQVSRSRPAAMRFVAAIAVAASMFWAVGLADSHPVGAVNWASRTTASSCSGQGQAGRVTWLRVNGNCKINAAENLLKDCDLRSLGDVFADNYYVGGSSSTNTNYGIYNFTLANYYVYTGANATGSATRVSSSIGPHLSRSITKEYYYC